MGRGTVAGRARDYSLEVYQIVEAEGSVRVRLAAVILSPPNLGSKNLGNSGFVCVGLPCASFSHVDHFHKKAACGGRGSQFHCSFHVEGLSVGQSRLSVAVWKAPKIEEFAAPNLGPPNGPNFGVAVSLPPNLVPNCIAGAGSISRPHFWGRETARFFGP